MIKFIDFVKLVGLPKLGYEDFIFQIFLINALFGMHAISIDTLHAVT